MSCTFSNHTCNLYSSEVLSHTCYAIYILETSSADMSFQTSKMQETPVIIDHAPQDGARPYRTGKRCCAPAWQTMHPHKFGGWLTPNTRLGRRCNWRNEENKEAGPGVCKMVLSPNSKTVSSGSYDGKVKLWDVGPGKVVAKWIRHAERMLSACWSVDGNRVGSGSYDGRARVWDVKSGKTIKTGHKDCVGSYMLSRPTRPNKNCDGRTHDTTSTTKNL